MNSAERSIFLEFNLPNAATWFYFSLIVAVTLFFQFTRVLSLRNWDLLALYLFAPGFLLVQEGGGQRYLGYTALLAASAYWFARCLVDVTASRRPVMRANLNTQGLAWFGGALFVCLTAAAVRGPMPAVGQVGKSPAAIAAVQEGATAVVAEAQNAVARPTDRAEVRQWVERGTAMVCHLAIVGGLFTICYRHFRDLEAGVSAATLYLLVPYTAFHVAQVHHVLPAALVVWAVACFRSAGCAGWLLGLAAGSSFFPVVLFPVWLHFYRGRGARSFAVGFLAATVVGLGLTVLVVWAAGQLPQDVWRLLRLSDWQPWKVPTTESVWTRTHWAYRLPVFVVYAAFVLATFVWPAVRNMGQLVAVSAAVLIGIQFWYSDRGGLYVLWYVPLLLILVFRPSTTELEPPVPEPWPGRLGRFARSAWGRLADRRGVSSAQLSAH